MTGNKACLSSAWSVSEWTRKPAATSVSLFEMGNCLRYNVSNGRANTVEHEPSLISVERTNLSLIGRGNLFQHETSHIFLIGRGNLFQHVTSHNFLIGREYLFNMKHTHNFLIGRGNLFQHVTSHNFLIGREYLFNTKHNITSWLGEDICSTWNIT